MDFSFSGGGFMGCYYLGVVHCLNKYIPRERVRRVAGASAGSLIAAYYLMDMPLDTSLKALIDLIQDVRSRPLGVFDRSNQIVDIIPRDLDKNLPDDAHVRASGRLFVAMTRLKDLKCVIVNQFETKKDLIDALNCSCFIPGWSGNHVSTYKGVKHIDGGFKNNLPVFDERTIRVCCFSGCADISPNTEVGLINGNAMGMPYNLTLKNLRRGKHAVWPPPLSYILGLLERGYYDTKEFILKNDLIQCDECFRSTQLMLQSGGNQGLSSPSCNTAKDVHRKPHRQQQPAVLALFEQDRTKSGRQIKSKYLQRSQTEVDKLEERVSRVSFARKLREKLQLVGSAKRSASPSVQPMESTTNLTTENRRRQMAPRSSMPTIVIKSDEDTLEDERTLADEEGELQMVSIADIMKSQEKEEEQEEKEEQEKLGTKTTIERLKMAQRTVSISSSKSGSNDSALGLDAPSPSRDMGGSTPTPDLPEESGVSKQKERPLDSSYQSSLVPTDRFDLSPSPLPSFPPSPNLNRHCTECICLRQKARMESLDDDDDELGREIARYRSMDSTKADKKTSNPSRGLSSLLRRLSNPKYAYSLERGHCGGGDGGENDAKLEESQPAREQQRRHSALAEQSSEIDLINVTPN